MSAPAPAALHAAILLDIEGTTTPLSFVSEVLFPYARRALRAYVDAHLDDPHLHDAIESLHDEWQHDAARATAAATADEMPPPWPDVAAYAEWLTDRDRKAFGLKALQGFIWQEGYEDGSLRGDVYPDVPVALARWHEAGIPVAIFSSGSVLAQQLLFRSTQYGDLTRWIRAYFDTSVGSKRSPESYRRIASALGCAPSRVLFISDVSAELEAAREAGCDTRLCVRDASKEKAGTPEDVPALVRLTDLFGSALS